MAPPIIRIPNKHLPSFKFLASMHREKQKRIVELLQDAKPVSSISELASLFADDFKEDEGKITDLIESLVNIFYIIYSEKEGKRKEFIDGIVEAAEKQMKPAKYDRESFRVTLHTILDLYDSTIGLISKAIYTVFDYNLVMGESQIITDVRPVFYSDISKKPEISVIVHNFKVTYFENDIEKTTYFAMNYDDLNALISQLEQAKIKQERLQEMFYKAGLTIFKY